MAQGQITVTDGKGGILVSGNIWVLLILGMLHRGYGLDVDQVRVFLDGKEVVKPASLESNKGNGGG